MRGRAWHRVRSLATCSRSGEPARRRSGPAATYRTFAGRLRRGRTWGRMDSRHRIAIGEAVEGEPAGEAEGIFLRELPRIRIVRQRLLLRGAVRTGSPADTSLMDGSPPCATASGPRVPPAVPARQVAREPPASAARKPTAAAHSARSRS
jgi:hypothetical protein